MSLGFNHLQKKRMTNLPGAVGNNIIVNRRSAPARVSPVRETPRVPARETTLAPVRDTPLAPAATRAKAMADDTARKPAVPEPKRDDDEQHWTYATAVAPLLTEAGEQVAAADDRVLLVYPMRSDPDTGAVLMRLKSVHATTGRLSYEWVVVHDPDASERLVADFSFIP